jgi:isopentenyl diphosphate isomerase/L-lactate dehydrogenase-like FMN-dependent dehydrogenase
MTTRQPQAIHTIADYERAAAERMSDDARSYIGGGAGNEITLRDNEAAWRRLALRPRALGAPDGADTSVELLGVPRPHPILVAPTAFARLTHPDGEIGIARAAAATATIMCLATLASVSPAAVAAQVPGATRWFQLYVFSDRGVSRDLVAAAAQAGYEALVVTVDRPVLGVREREQRAAVRESEALGYDRPTDTSAVIDARLRWSDIEHLVRDSSLPVIVKGVLTAEDARLAVAHGAAAVIVSNHGGRQLDTVLAGADALPEVVDAVGDEIDVLVDGGIRRGTDVVKALALGARAVLIGRPALWGLTVDGAAGVQHLLEILIAEVQNALTLVGAPRVADLDRSFLAPAPWAAGGPSFVADLPRADGEP